MKAGTHRVPAFSMQARTQPAEKIKAQNTKKIGKTDKKSFKKALTAFESCDIMYLTCEKGFLFARIFAFGGQREQSL